MNTTPTAIQTGEGTAPRAKINVRFNHTCEDQPLMRHFKFAEILTKPGTGDEKGRRFKWLYWYWEPESDKGRYDCGFSGILENHRQFKPLARKLGVAVCD